jgi:hypothetical protein
VVPPFCLDFSQTSTPPKRRDAPAKVAQPHKKVSPVTRSITSTPIALLEKLLLRSAKGIRINHKHKAETCDKDTPLSAMWP